LRGAPRGVFANQLTCQRPAPLVYASRVAPRYLRTSSRISGTRPAMRTTSRAERLNRRGGSSNDGGLLSSCAPAGPAAASSSATAAASAAASLIA
jgi:hypothetical protein